MFTTKEPDVDSSSYPEFAQVTCLTSPAVPVGYFAVPRGTTHLVGCEVTADMWSKSVS